MECFSEVMINEDLNDKEPVINRSAERISGVNKLGVLERNKDGNSGTQLTSIVKGTGRFHSWDQKGIQEPHHVETYW